MIDNTLYPAGDRLFPLEYEDICDLMLAELVGFFIIGNKAEFRRAFVEYMMDERDLYREAAEELLTEQYPEYEDIIRALVMIG